MTKETALQFQSVELGADENAARMRSQCERCGRRFRQGAHFCPYDGEPLKQGGEVGEDPLIGTVIDGRFDVLALLGEGGMGVVYRVRHTVLGREFALKVLRADVAREEQLGARFLREAQSAASVNHPNVCEITDFGELPGPRPYFVMELLTGTPLSRLLADRLPLERVVELAEQVARALEAAHRAGVIHRDLKPENVIVEATATEERVKVVDFGLAQIIGQSRLTQPGIVFGTPHYMSPEQASGGAIDPRADVYALGVILYEMVTGRVPFEAETYMGVLSKHLYLEPTPPSKVLGGAPLGALEGVILKCLQKKPEDRYASMADLLSDLQKLPHSTDGRVSIRPKELSDAETPRAPLKARRWPAAWLPWVLVPAAIMLAGALVVVVAFDSGAQGPEPPVPPQESVAGLASGPVLLGESEHGGTPVDAPPEGRATAPTPDEDAAVLRERPRDEPAAHGGSWQPASSAVPTSTAGAPRAGSSLGEGREPVAEEERPTKPKRRTDFQTSEIIDPWSQ